MILLGQRSDITFLAIGKDTDSSTSIQLIKNKYRENFRLLGNTSGVESYVNIMDVCVLSTFTEGISNSIIEYMALGKPVIATEGGGTNELVIDGFTGYLVPPENPDLLSNKIDFLLNHPEIRAKMGTNGKTRIATNFSIENMVEKYIESYKNCLSK
jgi:glycosyltransferase involved in cell wall biosynthesis